ncbi:DNA cytosine methyltransferase [Neisseria musculi]|nr:DNA cytosine methyltransferase [Neisseria musculi]
MRIVSALKPRRLVLENVTGLLNSNSGQDFQTVVQSLAQCGYLGYRRVLDARYFGVPTKRRRVFLVPDWEKCPPLSLWLTPDQLTDRPARRQQIAPGRTHTQLYLQASPAGRISTSRVATSALLPTDGVRWLSGGERLQIMGFAKDWMRPTLQKLGLPETPLCRKSHVGSLKNSSPHSD